jgi:hypothetical protein
MKHLIQSVLVVLGLLAAACQSAAPMSESTSAMQGKEVYLRHCIRFEKQKWDTTNYARGTLIPINTKVTLSAVKRGSVTIECPEFGSVTLRNIEKYTGGSMDVLVERMFSDESTDVSGSEFAADIEGGNMRLGMTKEETIWARGYPPAHRTATTTVNTWIYQENRWAHHTVVFTDGKLSDGRGIG